ncbi:hypothetical protein HYQ40_02955 [Aerococcaceae bacterium DSM 111021]|nr:hypothetical protein [Aerococcaceae bacterium DSM 111021]
MNTKYFSSIIKGKDVAQNAIIENYRQLYRKDSRFTYPEATLILPKSEKSNRR